LKRLTASDTRYPKLKLGENEKLSFHTVSEAGGD